MASAMVNSLGLVAAEGFLDLTPSTGFSSCGWLSPKISFSRDFNDEEKFGGRQIAEESSVSSEAGEEGDVAESAVVDFEFRRLDDSARMLPADELFSEGKLVPLQLAPLRSKADSDMAAAPLGLPVGEICSPGLCQMRRMLEAGGSDQCALYSPKAPRCSSRLRQLLGLKKASHNGYEGKAEAVLQKSPPPSISSEGFTTHKTSAARSIRHLLHRSQRSSQSVDAYLSLPLLRDSNSDSFSMSARLSLSSSSSSGPDHEELPRLSLDSDKPSRGRNLPRVRLVPKLKPCIEPSVRSNKVLDHRHHPSTASPIHAGTVAAGAGGNARSPLRREGLTIPSRGASLDSPRMNSSGKVVFHSLERSSSSPSTFNGGPRVKHRSVERSYSANVVRVPPVLNVPLCSLRGSSKSGSIFGFGQLFAPTSQKKDATSLSSSSWVAPRNSNSGSNSSAAGRIATKNSKIVRGI